jgi:hypothetical protein
MGGYRHAGDGGMVFCCGPKQKQNVDAGLPPERRLFPIKSRPFGRRAGMTTE